MENEDQVEIMDQDIDQFSRQAAVQDPAEEEVGDVIIHTDNQGHPQLEYDQEHYQ